MGGCVYTWMGIGGVRELLIAITTTITTIIKINKDDYYKSRNSLLTVNIITNRDLPKLPLGNIIIIVIIIGSPPPQSSLQVYFHLSPIRGDSFNPSIRQPLKWCSGELINITWSLQVREGGKGGR